jgi:trimeric autotransporter adhesin
MVIRIRVLTAGGATVCFPVGEPLSLSMKWDDGTTQIVTSAPDLCLGSTDLPGIAHVYTAAGTYDVRFDRYGVGPWLTALNGQNAYWNFPGVVGVFEPVRVFSFGNLGIQSFSGAFGGCSSLVEIPATLPSTVKNLANMFAGSNVNLANISQWDTSAVTSMAEMFLASSFNQPLSNWDVSNVINMDSMFQSTPFNRAIGNWDVSKVQKFGYMFAGSALNQAIGGWNVSSAQDMRFMFRGNQVFDQFLNGWDTSNVRNMRFMFSDASSFNQPLGAWDVSRVTSMDSMFESASTFNRNLRSWCVASLF